MSAQGVHYLPTRQRWETQGACATADGDLFFADWDDPQRLFKTEQAKAICNGICPVRIACLEDALAHSGSHGKWGVRGGLDEQERRTLKRQRQRKAKAA